VSNATTASGGSRSLGRLLPLLLLPVALIALGPVLRLLLEGIGFGDGLTTDHLTSVLARPSTATALRHSLITAGGGTLLSVLIGACFAFLVALTDIRGKGALVFCLMIPMMIPPQITALAWMQMAGPSSVVLKILGLAPPLGSPQPLHSATGIIILLGIQHASLVFLTFRAGLRMIPAELVEAARMSGAGACAGLGADGVAAVDAIADCGWLRWPLSPLWAISAFRRCLVFRRATQRCRP